MTVYLQSSIAEKEKKYNQIQEQIEDLEIKNEELNLTLNSDDIEAYMQKLAIEKYGYAYPDEIRFYDKSHN
jgi:cell division protein FtsB